MSKKVVGKKFAKKLVEDKDTGLTYTAYGICFMKEMKNCVLKAGPEARHRAVSIMGNLTC